MRIVRLLSPLALLLTVAACAPLVYTEYAPGTDFAGLQTFAWVAPEHRDVRNPVLDSELLDKKVETAVTGVLAQRGYRPASREAADFLVTYHTASEKELRSSPFRVGFGVFSGGYPWHSSIFISNDIRSYDQAVLIVDVVRAETDQLIWRGWRKRPLRQQAFSDAEIRELIAEILAEFPPGQRAS